LRNIHGELDRQSGDIPDAEELMKFINSITQYKTEDGSLVLGHRNMVDLHRLTKEYYYDPCMKGSISIKNVLPAVLNTSDFLKEKYSKPLEEINVSSLNFESNQVWAVEESGDIKDPYKLLPKIFNDIFSDNQTEFIYANEGSNSISHGGAAMTAYARMQYSEMVDLERKELTMRLLQYCELDTLAMVMIYEAWREWFKLPLP